MQRLAHTIRRTSSSSRLRPLHHPRRGFSILQHQRLGNGNYTNYKSNNAYNSTKYTGRGSMSAKRWLSITANNTAFSSISTPTSKSTPPTTTPSLWLSSFSLSPSSIPSTATRRAASTRSPASLLAKETQSASATKFVNAQHFVGNVRFLTETVCELFRLKQCSKANQVFQSELAKNFSPPLSMLELMIQLNLEYATEASTKEESYAALHMALRYCRLITGIYHRKPDIRWANEILYLFAKSNMTDLVIQTSKAFESMSLVANDSTDAIMMDTYIAAGKMPEAQRAYWGLKKRLKIMPSAASLTICNALLSFRVACNDVQQAFAELRDMRDCGVSPSIATYALLVKLLARNDHVDMIYEVLMEVHKLGLVQPPAEDDIIQPTKSFGEPNSTTTTSTTASSGSSEATISALSLLRPYVFQHLTQYGLTVRDLYSSALNAFTSQHRDDEAEVTVGFMAQVGLALSPSEHFGVLCMYADGDRADTCKELLAKLLDDEDHNASSLSVAEGDTAKGRLSLVHAILDHSDPRFLTFFKNLSKSGWRGIGDNIIEAVVQQDVDLVCLVMLRMAYHNNQEIGRALTWAIPYISTHDLQLTSRSILILTSFTRCIDSAELRTEALATLSEIAQQELSPVARLVADMINTLIVTTSGSPLSCAAIDGYAQQLVSLRIVAGMTITDIASALAFMFKPNATLDPSKRHVIVEDTTSGILKLKAEQRASTSDVATENTTASSSSLDEEVGAPSTASSTSSSASASAAANTKNTENVIHRFLRAVPSNRSEMGLVSQFLATFRARLLDYQKSQAATTHAQSTFDKSVATSTSPSTPSVSPSQQPHLLEVVLVLEANQVAITNYTYNVIMASALKTGDFASAQAIVEHMIQRKVGAPPSVSVDFDIPIPDTLAQDDDAYVRYFSFLLESYKNNTKLERIETVSRLPGTLSSPGHQIHRVLEDYISAGLVPSANMCIIALDCMGRSNLRSYVLKLWERMPQWKLDTDMRVFCAYLRSQQQVISFDSIEMELGRLCRYLQLDRLPRVALDELIHAGSTRLVPLKTVHYFKLLLEQGYTPSVSNVRHLIYMFSRAGHHNAALKLVERLKSSGSLSHELFEKIMKRFIRARNKKGFLATLELMDSLGVPSTVSTYRYIILGASLSQRTDSVLQVWQRLIDEGEVPDSALWTALFEALGRTLAYDKIVDMFTKDLHNTNYQLDPSVIQAAMSQLLSQGNKPIEAMQILKLLLDNDPKSIPIVTWYYWRQYFIRNDLHPFVHGTSAELIPAELKERVSASSRIMFSSFRSLADVVFMVMQGFIRTNDDVYATKLYMTLLGYSTLLSQFRLSSADIMPPVESIMELLRDGTSKSRLDALELVAPKEKITALGHKYTIRPDLALFKVVTLGREGVPHLDLTAAGDDLLNFLPDSH